MKPSVFSSLIGVLGSWFCVLLFSSPAMTVSEGPADILKTYLMDNYPWAEIEITDMRAGRDIPEEAPEKIKVVKGPLGNAVFSLEYRNNKKITVQASVKAFDWVVKSKRPFRKEHFLQKDDIYLSMMDITRMPKNAVGDPEAVIGKLLARSVIANMPIVEGMIEKSQKIKRGQKVILLVESRGLSISALGKTKERGYVGRPVKAINMSSKKEVIGVLIDENTVKVRY